MNRWRGKRAPSAQKAGTPASTASNGPVQTQGSHSTPPATPPPPPRAAAALPRLEHARVRSFSAALECATHDAGARRPEATSMTSPVPPLLAAACVTVLIGALIPGSSRAAEPSANAQKVSKSGISYLSDDQVGPPDLVSAIKSRRAGGKLLNLDRILLHSPNFAKGWNG